MIAVRLRRRQHFPFANPMQQVSAREGQVKLRSLIVPHADRFRASDDDRHTGGPAHSLLNAFVTGDPHAGDLALNSLPTSKRRAPLRWTRDSSSPRNTSNSGGDYWRKNKLRLFVSRPPVPRQIPYLGLPTRTGAGSPQTSGRRWPLSRRGPRPS